MNNDELRAWANDQIRSDMPWRVRVGRAVLRLLDQIGPEKSVVSVGRKGGLKGGRARAAKMTPEQRSESARKAAKARWARAAELLDREPGVPS